MVSDRFLLDGNEMSKRLGIYWPHLLMVMNLESGLSPSAGLSSPGHAIGVIQLMPSNLAGVGWSGSREEFGQLNDFEQLPYAERFLRPYASHNLHSDGRIHQALFVPATLGLPQFFPDDPSTVIASIDGRGLPAGISAGLRNALIAAYRSNAGFDHAHKGTITVQDLEDTDVRAATPASSPFQKAIARLRVLIPGLVEAGDQTEGPIADIGASPWIVTGALMALVIGGSMLLAQAHIVKLPAWAPRFMKA